MSHIKTLKSKTQKKEEIINRAIEFFSKYGFTGTRIDDITDALGIAKGTFYLFFKSKRELLMDCIGHLTHIAIPKETWEDIRREADYIRRFEKRLTAFLKVFPIFFGSLNLLRSCFQSKDSALAKKATDTYRMLVNPLRKDLQWAVDNGVVQKVDVEVFSFLLWGIGESVGHLLMMDSRYTIKNVVEIVMDFILKGLPFPNEKINKSNAENVYWEVKDCQGFKILLKNINFNQQNYFSGSLSNGELRIPIKNITSILFHHQDLQTSSIVSLKNDRKVTLKIDRNLSLSGESEFGQYSIGLKQISTIFLVSKKDEVEAQNVE